jgi:hypothetical protein
MLRQTIGRLSGHNLYCLLNNQPITALDVLGLGAATPCPAGQQQVLMTYYSFRKSEYELSLYDLAPLEKMSKILDAIKKALDALDAVNGLMGTEYNHRPYYECIPQCYVQTCQSDTVTDVSFDIDAPDSTSIVIIEYFTVETKYSYGPPGFILPSCINENRPPPITIL